MIIHKFHHSNRKIFPMKTYKNKRKAEVIKSNYQTELFFIFILLFFAESLPVRLNLMHFVY